VEHSTVNRWALKLLPVLEKGVSPPQAPRRYELARRRDLHRMIANGQMNDDGVDRTPAEQFYSLDE
jgi:hypothetical protein